MRPLPELGAASYLTKPVRQQDLLKALLEAVGRTPVAAPTQRATGEAKTQERVGRPFHILLIEDNAVNQRVALGLLQKRGHSVIVAGNGREALDAFRADRFDVVLMDVQMPVMDGFETTAAIWEKERTTGQHVPIIAMTAHAMKGDADTCLRAGMDDYVSSLRDFFPAVERIAADLSPATA